MSCNLHQQSSPLSLCFACPTLGFFEEQEQHLRCCVVHRLSRLLQGATFEEFETKEGEKLKDEEVFSAQAKEA